MSCITLLSDFGLQDAAVASARGILMQLAPGVTIVDISHLAEPFHMQQAAYLLRSAYRHFAPGTVHVVLFDIFSDRQPRLLLCEKEGYFFMAPDNGILALALGDRFERVWCCYDLQPPDVFRDWLHAVGRTAQRLLTQGADALGLEPCTMKVAPRHWQPIVQADSIECHVIYVDRFGNVVTNLTQELFRQTARDRGFRIQFMRDEEITTLSSHYFLAPEGAPLCRFNAEGYLEISINRGSAGTLLGLKPAGEQQVMYNTIKIYFE